LWEDASKETIEIAMEAAETATGAPTLHTIDASKTVERIVRSLPDGGAAHPAEPPGEELSLHHFPGTYSRKDGTGRIAVIEILKSTLRTREYVEKGESDARLLDAMRVGEQDGMQHFDGNIERLIARGSRDGHRPAYATNPGNLQFGDVRSKT